MTEVLNIKLSEFTAGQIDFLFVNSWEAILASGHIQFNDSPRRTWQVHNLFQYVRRSSPECNEIDAHFIESCEMSIGRKPRIENKLAGRLAVGSFPESDKPEDLFRFFALAEIGVGIAESPAIGILSQENENAWLTPASH